MILSVLFAAVVVTAWLIFAILNEDIDKNEKEREEDETQANNKNWTGYKQNCWALFEYFGRGKEKFYIRCGDLALLEWSDKNVLRV